MLWRASKKGARLNDACTLAKEFLLFFWGGKGSVLARVCVCRCVVCVCVLVYVVCVVLTASAGASERCFWPANRNPFGCKAARAQLMEKYLY